MKRKSQNMRAKPPNWKLHRVMKPRAVWCLRNAAQGEATGRHLARARRGVARSCKALGNARPRGTSHLPQLTVDGLAGFNAVVSSVKPKTGIGVDAIHPSIWSRISEKGKQLYTDLLNDVERTLTWPAQIQTLIYLLVPQTPTGERPIGLMPSIVRVWERMRKPNLDQWMISQSRSYDWACKGRSAEMAAWQHLVLEEGQDDELGMGRSTALLDMTKCFEQVRLWHVWRWGCHWGFATSASQDHPPCLQLPTESGIVKIGVTARDDLRSHHRWLSLFVCHPPHALHLAV